MSTRTWRATDYYEVLGVEPGADAEEITRAFRAQALDHHPDRTDDDQAREHFKALSDAYGVLGNPDRRARYDDVRRAPAAGGAPTGHPVASRPASASGRAPVPAPDENRPLSVRALPRRRHARWASIGGTALVVAGLLAVGLVAWLVVAGPDTTTNGSDPTGRNITLGLVAMKLVVVGIVFVVLGHRRRRYP